MDIFSCFILANKYKEARERVREAGFACLEGTLMVDSRAQAG